MVVQSPEGMASIDVEETHLEKKRRVSSRLQLKQKPPQKELLVRQRVDLLDDGPRKKPNVTADSAGPEPEPEPEELPSLEKSDRVRVKETLRLFNKHYLYFVQVGLFVSWVGLFKFCHFSSVMSQPAIQFNFRKKRRGR